MREPQKYLAISTRGFFLDAFSKTMLISVLFLKAFNISRDPDAKYRMRLFLRWSERCS
jgi:hypothetical protein